MLDIPRIPIPKTDLLKMSVDERSLFLSLGYASNQVIALWKLVSIATNTTGRDPVEERLSGAQTHLLVRLLIGAMREALKLVEKRFVGSPLGRHFIPLLDAQAAQALDRLKKRFSGPDMLVTIRDNFAFHHPTRDDMEAAFQQAIFSEDDEAENWCIYMTPALLNTFFFVSDFVVVHGMANALKERMLTRHTENCWANWPL